MAMSGRVAGFLPSTSGLKFPNSFPAGIPVVNVAIPPLPPITLGDASNGVCGGMVYVVMDLFLAQPRLLPPTTTTLPAGGSSLMNYIVARLIDGFALPLGPASNAYRYIEYMSTLDHDTLISRGVPWVITTNEWLEPGRPQRDRLRSRCRLVGARGTDRQIYTMTRRGA